MSSQPSAFRSPDARPPRPVVLDAHPVGDLLELPVAEVVEERVAEDVVRPPPWRKSSGHCIVDFSFSRSGPISSLMSECMSVMSRSGRPSLS